MSSEDIILGLIKFVSETGRLPKPDEPGLEGLISSAIKHFGSLEDALRIAGLLTPSVRTARTVRARRASLRSSQASRASAWSAYPKDYFLNLLNLKRTSHYNSPASNGTPSWWERRSNTQYACSACRGTIEKGERYIGSKKLRPGMRGIYGYRVTYFTDYYHVVCLLRIAKAEVEKDIRGASSEINSINKEIADFTEEMSLKRKQIGDCRTIMQEARQDYERSGFWRKVAKWSGFHYVLWSKNREISRLEKEITNIENRKIPQRKTQITSLKGRIGDLELRLNEIDTKIQDLVSHQQPE